MKTDAEEKTLLMMESLPRHSSFVQPNFYGSTFGYSDSLHGLPLEGGIASRKAVDWALDFSIAANVLLLLLKVFATYVTGSLAILASMVDSLLDLLSQVGSDPCQSLPEAAAIAAAAGALMMDAHNPAKVVLYCTDKVSAQGIDEDFPAGRRRLEPVGVIICAALMATAALEVLRESAAKIVVHLQDPSGDPPMPKASLVANIIIGSAILIKAVMYVWCSRISKATESQSIAAVAQDHFNDVLSNGVALVAAVASTMHDGGRYWWIDSVGAIVISLYIIYSWVETGREQVEMIVGRSADPEFLEQIRNIVNSHHHSLDCDIIRAYHFGPKFLVEVEVVLPEDTPLRSSHDIGMQLQWKIESLEQVERAFVHIDYTTRDYDEHDERSWKRMKSIDSMDSHTPSPTKPNPKGFSTEASV